MKECLDHQVNIEEENGEYLKFRISTGQMCKHMDDPCIFSTANIAESTIVPLAPMSLPQLVVTASDGRSRR
jgi:hypothetical protein